MIREVMNRQVCQAISNQHILQPTTWKYKDPKNPPFQAPPRFMQVRNVGELGDGIGMTHFRKLVHASF